MIMLTLVHGDTAICVSYDSSHIFGVCLKVLAPGPKGSVMTRNFTFHGCLAPNSKQSDVLKICGITQLLNAAMAGYHATIFAYGQTGSGKTYTMSGREDVIDSDDYAGESLELPELHWGDHTTREPMCVLLLNVLELGKLLETCSWMLHVSVADAHCHARSAWEALMSLWAPSLCWEAL